MCFQYRGTWPGLYRKTDPAGVDWILGRRLLECSLGILTLLENVHTKCQVIGWTEGDKLICTCSEGWPGTSTTSSEDGKAHPCRGAAQCGESEPERGGGSCARKPPMRERPVHSPPSAKLYFNFSYLIRHGFTLSPRLECSGTISAHCNLQPPVETGFCHVGQAVLKHLTSSDPPASASQSAGITGLSHNAQPYNKKNEREKERGRDFRKREKRRKKEIAKERKKKKKEEEILEKERKGERKKQQKKEKRMKEKDTLLFFLLRWNLALSPRLECKTKFCYVGQAGIKLLTSDDPPTSASQSAGITGVSYCAWYTILLIPNAFGEMGEGARVRRGPPKLPTPPNTAQARAHARTRTHAPHALPAPTSSRASAPQGRPRASGKLLLRPERCLLSPPERRAAAPPLPRPPGWKTNTALPCPSS
ncbi:hypothetical protein AAY473_012300 [Plecturocebus cupreus]